MVVLAQVAREEQVAAEQGRVFGEVSQWNVKVARLLERSLQESNFLIKNVNIVTVIELNQDRKNVCENLEDEINVKVMLNHGFRSDALPVQNSVQIVTESKI